MNIKSNIRKLTYVFIVLFVLLSGGLVYWQVGVSAQVTSNIHNSRHCLPDSAPMRGRIFDRNGVLLAESVPSTTGCGYIRKYFEPSLAGLIGYYVDPTLPATGLEAQYNTYLSGQVGVTALDNQLNQLLHRPPVGDDIYLTIDVRIQRTVVADFAKDVAPTDNVNVFQTNRGAAIVEDPRTGEILAMYSSPGYDPNKLVQTLAAGDFSYYNSLNTNPEQPLFFRPIQGTYVPGSVYKTMTLSAALDSGNSQLTDLFYNDKNPNHPQAIGPVTIGSGDNSESFGPIGNNLCCYTKTYPVDLEYGYVHSDNIIFAQVGAKTGVNTWLAYNKRFYVGEQIPFDLPVTPSQVTPPNGKPLQINGLGENSFGQGVDTISPLQMSLLTSTIANNGNMMRQHVVMKIVDPNGAVVQANNPQSLGSPISSQTASDVLRAMYGVVRCGSGSVVPPLINSPWALTAKTGTGEVGGGKAANAWLITAAPYQNPRLTIVMMKENGGEGGTVNGPTVADIYNTVFTQYMKIPAPAAPDPNYCTSTGLLQ
ncbi:MAG: penicillin-binding transpeptidase domain-containing protein [Ktedonobacteraceae bacterium]